MWELSQLRVHCQQPCLPLLPPLQQLLLLACTAATVAHKATGRRLACCLLLQGRTLEQQLHKGRQQVAFDRNTCGLAARRHRTYVLLSAQHPWATGLDVHMYMGQALLVGQQVCCWLLQGRTLKQ
jgi:hypothetical protein